MATVNAYPNFNVQDDAKDLHKAMKGMGTDKKAIIKIICHRSSAQRQAIVMAFKTMFGKDLISELKSELRGDMEHVILSLMKPPAVYDAEELHRAISGLGTDEADMIEIMCTRNNNEIHEMKAAYKMMYGRELEKSLKHDTSRTFERLMVALCNGARDESNFTDQVRAQKDAQELIKAGIKKAGTDEATFMSILCMQNMHQLRLVFQEYGKIAKHEIEEDIKKEFSGDMEKGLLTLVACAKSMPTYFAEKAHIAMAKIGTSDKDLIRVCVTRCEKDMELIKKEYKRLYGEDLSKVIKKETSGSYEDALIALVN